MIDINEIIENEQIITYFQPIVSTYQGKVAGVEALVRGIDENGQIISPIHLFEAAIGANLVIELDRLCQKKAIQTYSHKFSERADLILFMNVDNSVIHLHSEKDSIYDYVLEYGLRPENIVLEINELQSEDMASMTAIKTFTNRYRDKGFMICIDDIGSGFSNLDRIIILKPDIIKIDRLLLNDIHNHYYKQQVVSMIIKLAEKTGALIVAEGVEVMPEILTVLQYGAHMLQGFYIAKPFEMDMNDMVELEDKIRIISEEQTAYLSSYLVDRCLANATLRDKFETIRALIYDVEPEIQEDTLYEILKDYPSIECAYIIDSNGYQNTDTIFNTNAILSKKPIFNPYKKGDNAKLKEYYYVLKTTHQELFVSEEYLSLATGSKCITISGYCCEKNRKSILCLDIVT